ncbi:hypothetical protein Vadar_029780 [Vaccinium darrowii]|uniref:Uncharacterized protein n=1 Tax=Vaccinium darrowii TaxID=229202 RepID=A0ACB7XE72_9ERIC|nr:hypothetical protein Vadar_029780 [Vaccinium darrowii]
MPHTTVITAQDFYKVCSNTTNYKVGSRFQSNLNRILYRGLYNDGGDSIFSNKTEGEGPDKSTVFFSAEAMLHLPTASIASTSQATRSLKNVPLRKKQSFGTSSVLFELDKFAAILDEMFLNLTSFATSIPSNRMYATNEANVGNFTKLYGMVQCTPDLSPVLCRSCLGGISVYLVHVCGAGKRGGRLLAPSCNVRYELYPFLATHRSMSSVGVRVSN